jgi:hypothetical protein
MPDANAKKQKRTACIDVDGDRAGVVEGSLKDEHQSLLAVTSRHFKESHDQHCQRTTGAKKPQHSPVDDALNWFIRCNELATEVKKCFTEVPSAATMEVAREKQEEHTEILNKLSGFCHSIRSLPPSPTRETRDQTGRSPASKVAAV